MKGIEIKGLVKNYSKVSALKNINLTFEENKIYGLLGRNGAGKTTLLNSITGRIFPSIGEIFIDGEEAAENDHALGKTFMMCEDNYYPEKMKVKDAAKWTKEFYPAFDEDYFNELCVKFELNVNKKIKALSTGYASIFKLISALSTNVPYLILDEPVLGLDAGYRDLFYKLFIRKYSEKPFTVIFSTHLIGEAANLIEEAVIINKGVIMRKQPVDELLAQGLTLSGTASAIDNFIKDMPVLGVDSLGGLKTAYLIGEFDQKTLPPGIEAGKMDLQKLFIHLTDDQGGAKCI